MKRFLLAACALLGASPTFAQHINVLEHVRFRDADLETEFQNSRRDLLLDMDARVLVDIDERGLLLALAKSRGDLSVATTELEARIDLLRVAVDGFLKAQAALSELRIRRAAVERATEAGKADLVSSEQARFMSANAVLATNGSAAIQSLKDYRKAVREGGDPVRTLELEGDFAKLNAAVLQDDYEPMTIALGDVLKRELRVSGEQLLADMSGGDTYSLLVKATLHDGSGGATPVHVQGYDKIASGSPDPYPRFRIAPDDRARREYEASKKLKEFVDAARDGTLGEELKKARDAVITELKALRETLESEVLSGAVDKLLTDLAASTDPALAPIAKDLQTLRTLLATLKKTYAGGTGNDLDQFLQLATDFQVAGTSLIADLQRFADELPTLADRLIEGLKNRADEASTSVVAALKKTKEALTANVAIQAVVGRITGMLQAFGLVVGIVQEVVDVERRARDLLPNESLDTSIDVKRVTARHPGDRLIVTVVVQRKAKSGNDADDPEPLEGIQTFRLRLVGLYEVPRGALFFADPRSASLAPGQDYEAAPAIGYVFHYGKQDDAFWNDVLDPGISLSVSLLDFEDSADFELGISAGLTFFKDCLWVGYGRNLQAESDFFYVGINPLVLGELWTRDEPTRGGNN